LYNCLTSFSRGKLIRNLNNDRRGARPWVRFRSFFFFPFGRARICRVSRSSEWKKCINVKSLSGRVGLILGWFDFDSNETKNHGQTHFFRDEWIHYLTLALLMEYRLTPRISSQARDWVKNLVYFFRTSGISQSKSDNT